MGEKARRAREKAQRAKEVAATTRRWARYIVLGGIGLSLASIALFNQCTKDDDPQETSPVTSGDDCTVVGDDRIPDGTPIEAAYTDPSVQKIQRRIIDAGIPLVGGVDGYFGEISCRGLGEFQKISDTTVDLKLGPVTASLLDISLLELEPKQ